MIYLFCKHHVVDFARWKEGFARHLSARQAGGATADALLFRNVAKRQEISILLGWCDLRRARMFAQSVSWQIAMQEMGVVGVPEILFLELALLTSCESRHGRTSRE